jgi:subtilisin family serine protease
MRVIVKKKLNIRQSPDTLVRPIGQLQVGSLIDIDTLPVKGEEIDGNSIWYKGREGSYYWSGGIQKTNTPNLIKTDLTVNVKENVNWGINQLNIPSIWNKYKGDSVKVAILDSGIEKTHPDLVEAIKACQDFSFSENTGCSDIMGHGTHCSGIIGARENGFGITGLAPHCEFYIGKVINDDFGIHPLYLKNALKWAISQKVDIVSMSIGFQESDDTVYEQIKAAHSAGLILVAAGGNNSGGTILNDLLYPAKYSECISVGAISQNNGSEGISVVSNNLDIVAPGIKIYSTDIKSKGFYSYQDGTSMAAAFVSGVVALVVQKLKSNSIMVTPDNIKNLLKNSSSSFAENNNPSGFNSGIINPQHFISLA